jgi:hypothetical protein
MCRVLGIARAGYYQWLHNLSLTVLLRTSVYFA